MSIIIVTSSQGLSFQGATSILIHTDKHSSCNRNPIQNIQKLMFINMYRLICHLSLIQQVLVGQQYNTIKYNAMQCNAIQYNTIQYNTIQYNTIQYNTIQYNTIQYNTIQYNTIQYKMFIQGCPIGTAALSWVLSSVCVNLTSAKTSLSRVKRTYNCHYIS